MSHLLQHYLYPRAPQNSCDADSRAGILDSDLASTLTSQPPTSTASPYSSDGMSSSTASRFRSRLRASGIFGKRREGTTHLANRQPVSGDSQAPVVQTTSEPVIQAEFSEPTTSPNSTCTGEQSTQRTNQTPPTAATSLSSNASRSRDAKATQSQLEQPPEAGRFKRFVKRRVCAMGLTRRNSTTEKVDAAYEAYLAQWDAEFSGKLSVLAESAAASAQSHSAAVIENERLRKETASLQRALCWEKALQEQDADNRVSNFPPLNYDGPISEWRRLNTVAKFHAHREERNALAAELADERMALAALRSPEGLTVDALLQRCSAAERTAERAMQERDDARTSLFGANAQKEAAQARATLATRTAEEFENLSAQLKETSNQSLALAATKTRQYEEAMRRLQDGSAGMHEADSARQEVACLHNAVSILYRQVEHLAGAAPATTEGIAEWARTLPQHVPEPDMEMVPLSSFKAAIASFQPICNLAAELRDDLAGQFVQTLRPEDKAMATERVFGPTSVHNALQIARYAARTFRDGYGRELERAESYQLMLQEHGLAA